MAECLWLMSALMNVVDCLERELCYGRVLMAYECFHECCGLFGGSFAMAECLWLMSALMNVVDCLEGALLWPSDYGL